MGKKKKEKIEFRYYELPQNEVVMALWGEKWHRIYGRDTEGLHFHNLLEIGYCYGGTGDIILEGEADRFSKQMISVIPRYFPHTTISDIGVVGMWEYLFIDEEKFLYEVYKEDLLLARKFISILHKNALFMKAEKGKRMEQLIHSIIYEMRHKEVFYLEKVKGLIWALLLEIIRMNKDAEMIERTGVTQGLQIESALSYVEEHYCLPLKVEDLAEVCHMSETHFRRLFGTYMNMTPVEYINLARIQKACELIKKTDDTMKNIALKVGYLTPSTFNRNFKRIIGISPYEWRNEPDNYESKLLNYHISTLKGW